MVKHSDNDNGWFSQILIPEGADVYRNGKLYETLNKDIIISFDPINHTYQSTNTIDYYFKGRMARFYADDNFVIQPNTDIGYATYEDQQDGKEITSIYTNKVTK